MIERILSDPQGRFLKCVHRLPWFAGFTRACGEPAKFRWGGEPCCQGHVPERELALLLEAERPPVLLGSKVPHLDLAKHRVRPADEGGST